MPKPVLLPCILLAVVALLGASIVSVAVFGMAHDDGVYLVTAKSLAEGTGYRIVSLPNSPFETKYPVLFPLLLSVVWRINPHFPDNGTIFKSIPVIATVLWLVVCYWFTRRYGGLPKNAALWAIVFVAVNQWSLLMLGTLMSESVFSLLLIVTLTLLVRLDEQPSMSVAAVAGICAAATCLTRSAGIPLIGAGIIALAFRKHYREAAVFSGVAAPFLGAWALWQSRAVDLGTSIENYYSARSYLVDSLFYQKVPITAMLRLVLKNIYFLLGYPVRQLFGLYPSPHVFRFVVPIGGLVFWALVFRGWRRSPSRLVVVKLFVCFYLSMVLVYVFLPDRYLLQLLPLLLIFVLCDLPAKTPRWILPAAAAIPLMLGFYFTRNTLAHRVVAFGQPPWVEPSPVVDWQEMSKLYEWVRNNVPDDGVLLTNYDPALYLYTGRRAIRPFGVQGAELFFGIHRDLAVKVREFLDVADKYHSKYFVESGHDTEEDPAYSSMIDALIRSGRLRLHWQLAPHYRVFEILPLEQEKIVATGTALAEVGKSY